MRRRPKAAPAATEATDIRLELLEQLRPLLRQGLKHEGQAFVGAYEGGPVISDNLAQQLIAIGWARLDGDRLVLAEEPDER